MRAFPSEDYANSLKELDLGVNSLPIQRSLDLLWNLDADCFNFHVQNDQRPYTRRGLLSVINSLYDPLGFVAPITVQGKILLRKLTEDAADWDSPLPENNRRLWKAWRDSLQDLQHVQVPRSYGPTSLSGAKFKELSVFSDASEKVIVAVAYLKTVDSDGNCHTGFITGKARVAPQPELTIPRLELCELRETHRVRFLIREIQQETYADEMQCLKHNKTLPKTSSLQKLDPFIDQSELLRVGGRLVKADLSSEEKRPLIIPGRIHVTLLLIRHFNEQTHHQGRHFTEGAIRSAGYWIIGGKRRVSSLIHSCVVCRRLRRGCETQKMADLPTDRLSAEPPSQMWDWMCSAPGQYLLVRQEVAMQKAKDGLCYSHV